MKKDLHNDSSVKKTLRPTEDFTEEDTWRIFRIMAEFVEGFETLSKVEKAVSIFGSSRLKPESPYYQKAVELGANLVKEGFAVITGGGPGIMEAANKGAKEAGGHSIGLTIELPFQEPPNEYLTTSIDFHYFFVRKVVFVKYAKAFVIFPGGYGTMDELFESLNLISTQHIKQFPVILVGSEHWQNLLRWMNVKLLKTGVLEDRHLEVFQVTDDIDKVVEIIQRYCDTEGCG